MMRPRFAVIALALFASPALAAEPAVRDKARLFQADTVASVKRLVAPIEERLHVEVRVATVTDVPSLPPPRRAAHLAQMAAKLLEAAPPRGTNDVVLIVLCPLWKETAVVAGPDDFARRVTPAHREAMRPYFAHVFDAPDQELPTAVDSVCRDLVRLAHPRLTILDQARLFSPGAITQAARELEAFQGPYDVKLVIDTVESLTDLDPEVDLKAWEALNRREKARRLAKLAGDRADRLKQQGLFHHGAYVLIVAHPADVSVINWPVGFDGDLTGHTRGQLHKTFSRRSEERTDEALFTAVRLFKAYQERIRPTSAPLETTAALMLLGTLVASWVVLRLVRIKVAGADRPRLYTPALMGSLFGVPAGAWVYDQLFEAERGTVPPDPTPQIDSFLVEPPALPPAAPDAPPADQARDPGAGEPF